MRFILTLLDIWRMSHTRYVDHPTLPTRKRTWTDGTF